jgi:hypothetical protein
VRPTEAAATVMPRTTYVLLAVQHDAATDVVPPAAVGENLLSAVEWRVLDQSIYEHEITLVGAYELQRPLAAGDDALRRIFIESSQP